MADQPFDWTQVAHAAKGWMEEHETAPKYLLLPVLTNDEIMELAEEIYDVPVRRAMVEVPRFVDELPKGGPPFGTPIITPPIITPPRGSVFAREQLIQLAKQGKLTTEDIQRMTMEEYTTIRHILLPQMAEAMRKDGERTGNPFTSLKNL